MRRLLPLLPFVPAGLAAVALAAFGGVSYAGLAGGAAADQYAKKVTICHHARGKGGTKHVTIRVSRNALPAHLRHGDTIGPCNSARAKKVHGSKNHAKKFHKRAKSKGKGKGRGR